MAPFSPESSEHSDAILCERAGDGDAIAFQTLIRRHAPAMRAYAIRLTGSRADADDVLQETFIRAWEKISTVEDPAKAKNWLMTLTTRKAIDHIRRRKDTVELDSIEAQSTAESTVDPEQSAITGSQLGALNELLKTLPLEQQQIWAMREIGGFTYKKIAEELSLPEATVRGRLARARATLLKGMASWN